jgi:tripartite ATP-independent transporter DctM subunit
MASTALIGSIAIPEVERRGYDRRLSLGSFAIAGTLAVLIPPSTLMIIYSVLTNVSLGQLFFAGIFPGFLLAILICLYILLRVKINKSLCPPTASVGWKERIISLKGTTAVIFCFLIIFGGIYAGIWSAVEASAAGAFLSFFCTLIYRRFKWAKFKAALDSTLRLCVMIYVIFIAAYSLNYFVFVSKLDVALVQLVTSLGVPNWIVMVIILIVLSIMGCIFDLFALIMVSVAVFLPVCISIGFDPVWFGIVLISASELALLTPPVGVNLFIIKNAAPKDTTFTDVVLGSFPYIIVVWIYFAIMIAFPQIALYLPSIIK